MVAARSLIALSVLLVACEEPLVVPVPSEPTLAVHEPHLEGADWADVVWEAPGADPTVPFGDSERAVNGARGGIGGGTDVYSLTLDDTRPHLTVGFSDRVVLDGPGPDLVVFENPFDITGGGRFMDPLLVSVSPDGVVFVTFPHVYGLDHYSDAPDDWQGFAGVTPTLLHEDVPDGLTADDPATGGDRFDLADLPAGPLRDQILDSGVVAIRLEAAARHSDPITQQPFPADPVSNGPDVDAVYAWTFGAR